MDPGSVPRAWGGHRSGEGAVGVGTRVTMTIDEFLPVVGGPQVQLARLAPLLHVRGVRTSVVTRRIRPGGPRRERGEHAEIVRLRGLRPTAGPSRSFPARAAAWIVKDRPHVVHARGLDSSSAVAAMIGAGAIRRPYVVTVLTAGPHGDVARLRATAAGRQRLRRFLRTAAAFVCVGAGVEHDLHELGIDRRRVMRIPNGVDIGHFRPAPADGPPPEHRRAALGLPRHGPLTVTVGALEPEKRIDHLIAAQTSIPGTLLIVGDGPERAALEQLARAVGVAERVVFRPFVADIAPLLGCADAYVTCADHDGVSNAVLEAMASGIPVVAARGVGVVDLVDATTGVLVPPRAPDAIARATAALLADEPRRRALGAAGRLRVVAGYTLTSTADELAALYHGLRR